MNPQVTVSTTANYCLIRLSGRFVEDESDVALIEQVETQCALGQTRFIIDLSGLNYMNSTGINLLVKCIKRLNERNAQLVFTAAPNHIVELLGIIKLNSIIHISPSLEEGIQTLNLA
jgi:anti-sigma B factor antagonist